MKALIVDDSKINIKVAEKMLEKLGIATDFALSGYECLEKVKTNTYDVIFMDIMMPEMDGVETFHKLQDLDEFKTPVVTLTADVNINAEEKYLKEGFYAYLSKPIDLTKLNKIITDINLK